MSLPENERRPEAGPGATGDGVAAVIHECTRWDDCARELRAPTSVARRRGPVCLRRALLETMAERRWSA